MDSTKTQATRRKLTDGEFHDAISCLPPEVQKTIKRIATDSDGNRSAFDAPPYPVEGENGGIWWKLPGTNAYKISEDPNGGVDWKNSCHKRPGEFLHVVIGTLVAAFLAVIGTVSLMVWAIR